MSDHAYDRIVGGETMAGVFIIGDRFPVGHAIQELLLMVGCSQQSEWNGRAVHLPL